MNLMLKIAKARTMIGVTKDGQNKFAGYSYFQLTDIYNASKQPLLDIGLATVPRQTMEFHGEEPYYTFYLDVYNTEDMSEMTTLSVITKHNSLKGCTEGQNSGGNNTYSLKVLMQNLLMLDDNQDDPDGKNDHKSMVKEPVVKAKVKTRAELVASYIGMDKAKQDTYMKDYMVKEGKTTPVDAKFIKAYFLNEVAGIEKW